MAPKTEIEFVMEFVMEGPPPPSPPPSPPQSLHCNLCAGMDWTKADTLARQGSRDPRAAPTQPAARGQETPSVYNQHNMTTPTQRLRGPEIRPQPQVQSFVYMRPGGMKDRPVAVDLTSGSLRRAEIRRKNAVASRRYRFKQQQRNAAEKRRLQASQRSHQQANAGSERKEVNDWKTPARLSWSLSWLLNPES